jgi:hypothetical protein
MVALASAPAADFDFATDGGLRIYAYQSPQERLRRRGLIKDRRQRGQGSGLLRIDADRPGDRRQKLPPKKRGRK